MRTQNSRLLQHRIRNYPSSGNVGLQPTTIHENLPPNLRGSLEHLDLRPESAPVGTADLRRSLPPWFSRDSGCIGLSFHPLILVQTRGALQEGWSLVRQQQRRCHVGRIHASCCLHESEWRSWSFRAALAFYYR